MDNVSATTYRSEASPNRRLSRDLFGEAYSQGLRRTISFLLSRGTGRDVAEEIAQYAWAQGWEYCGQLRCADSLQPWINSIAYNQLCNDKRRRLRYETGVDVSDVSTPEPVNTLDFGLILKRCSPLERLLLAQRYVEGMQMKEIAKLHGLSELAVRLRIHRCRRALRSFCQQQAA